MNIVQKLEKIAKYQDEIKEDMKEAINSYVDEGIVSYASLLFQPSIHFEVRGLTFKIDTDTEYASIKNDVCDRTIPTSMEEMVERMTNNKVAKRCATQALLQLKFLTTK